MTTERALLAIMSLIMAGGNAALYFETAGEHVPSGVLALAWVIMTAWLVDVRSIITRGRNNDSER